ncbi:cell division ATP-binding protein FtsE [Bowmanella denitrificans]|uniref:Cell division ATP-binding protein FtsE n=1 Tax=Bowmanella denitrificans TaxID=366582 RepID=A0ABP3HMT2_9ALTE|nr:cell division ATP-binding protein FtsE [Bowmanella denitrificans]
MIRFEQVSKTYPGGQQALRQVNFHIAPGEMAFLTGHSGAGKSTLLKLISIMERPTVGRVLINGHDLNVIHRRQVPFIRRDIGMIFQSHQLLMDKSVFDNVALPLIIEGHTHKEIAKRVGAVLERVGLADKSRCLPITLSGGEQQRVGIARAVVNKPPLLLADEPTGNLDPKLSLEIIRLFEDFNQAGVAVLIATHDLGLIARMKYRTLTLKKGQMITDGLTEEWPGDDDEPAI